MSDFMQSGKVSEFDAVHSINDAGNSGSDKETYSLFAACDHEACCIWGQLVGVSQLPGGGEKIAETILAEGRRLNVKEFAGSATDNASDVLKKFVSEM